MMGVSLDTNILLYASDARSQFHARAKRLLNDLLLGENIVYLFWETVHGYIRIATHHSVFASPLSPAEASSNIHNLIVHPLVEMIGANTQSWEIYQRLSRELNVCGNLVPDAVLASVLEANGIKILYTNDRDFWKFPFLQPNNPF
ncbi:MAG: PIN domain-containing protein [Chitinivibrionales bacterium]|nr:PIN domain-containing protein [Chitinivibrionales bacterium]